MKFSERYREVVLFFIIYHQPDTEWWIDNGDTLQPPKYKPKTI